MTYSVLLPQAVFIFNNLVLLCKHIFSIFIKTISKASFNVFLCFMKPGCSRNLVFDMKCTRELDSKASMVTTDRDQKAAVVLLEPVYYRDWENLSTVRKLKETFILLHLDRLYNREKVGTAKLLPMQWGN